MNYTKKDGVLAFVLFGLAMLAPCLFNALPTMTTLPAGWLNAIDLIGILLQIGVCLAFVLATKGTLASIGFQKDKLAQSILLGILGGVLLVAAKGLFCHAMGASRVGFAGATAFGLVSFTISGIQEEVMFRGYIQTRLRGLFRSPIVIYVIVAAMFLIAHYPVMWMMGGTVETDRVICLLVLSFVCGMIYNKTENVTGAIVAHLMYNLVLFY